MATEANVFGFTQGFFGTALDNAVAQQVQAGLAYATTWLHAAGAVWLFATIYLGLFQNLSINRLTTRVLRALIVTAIVLHPVLYTQFVVQPITNGGSNQIVQIFGGTLGAQNVPDQFVAIYNNIEHISAQLRAQANGYLQFSDRITISLAEFACKLLLAPEYAIWFSLHAFQAMLVIAGTVVIIFWLFDKTQGYAEAWQGKVVGSFIATILLSATLQIIFLMNTAYMTPAGNLPKGADGKSLNIPEGIEHLFGIAVVFLVGIFFMIISVFIGFSIARSNGFDAGNVINKMSRAINSIGRR